MRWDNGRWIDIQRFHETHFVATGRDEGDLRVVHVHRDPLEIIASAFLYHLGSSEQWLSDRQYTWKSLMAMLEDPLWKEIPAFPRAGPWQRVLLGGTAASAVFWEAARAWPGVLTMMRTFRWCHDTPRQCVNVYPCHVGVTHQQLREATGEMVGMALGPAAAVDGELLDQHFAELEIPVDHQTDDEAKAQLAIILRSNPIFLTIYCRAALQTGYWHIWMATTTTITLSAGLPCDQF
ncbi:MAG: hypothetical protein Q8P67_02295 [archaeon]|nr:hypothetical protein [archaeon]